MVWCGLLKDRLIIPYFSDGVNCKIYLEMLGDALLLDLGLLMSGNPERTIVWGCTVVHKLVFVLTNISHRESVVGDEWNGLHDPRI